MPVGFDFHCGQYLEIQHPDGAVPLSIASAPWRLPELHLHYRSTPGLAEAMRMDELLGRRTALPVHGPLGDVRIDVPPRQPLLLVAGGTGIAQAMSFLDAFQRQPPDARVTLVWCADDPADFYLRAELEALQGDWLRCELFADPRRTPQNQGLTWLRGPGAAMARGAADVLLCGGPGFVYPACDALAAGGAAMALMQSDVFSYAPRGASG